jgi:hypothetical protein
MKYQLGDQFIYRVNGFSYLNGKVLTIIRLNDKYNLYHAKAGCCKTITISEEKLDEMEKIFSETKLNHTCSAS